DFAVRIWIDERTDPGVRYDVLVRDIAEVETPEVRYELDGLWPNHGASSDILRYEILHREGGAYLDCLDVFPGPPLAAATFPDGAPDAGRPVFGAELAGPRLLFHVTRHAVGRDALAPGTEAMFATPGCPTLRRLADEARAAYDGPRWSHKQVTFGPRPPPDPSPLAAWGRGPVVSLRELVARRAI